MGGFELPPRLTLPLESRSERTESRSSGPASGSSRKGQPWSETEHLQFLAGLKKLGRGNWRGISRYFVPSRTPTQVASHAQKHFLRTNGVCKRKSRFSLLEQAASAQGLLTSDAQALVSAPLAMPIFCGLPAFAVGLANQTQPYRAATSSDSSAECGGVAPTRCGSCPESSAAPAFTKICRPVPYHASARMPDMAKLRADLAAAAAADDKLSTLQPSSRSAFFPVQPCPAISV